MNRPVGPLSCAAVPQVFFPGQAPSQPGSCVPSCERGDHPTSTRASCVPCQSSVATACTSPVRQSPPCALISEQGWDKVLFWHIVIVSNDVWSLSLSLGPPEMRHSLFSPKLYLIWLIVWSHHHVWTVIFEIKQIRSSSVTLDPRSWCDVV